MDANKAARRHPTRQELGRAAEDAAATFLEAHGLQILQRNYRRRLGELDVVAREGDTLVIVEVRMRASKLYGGAAASVGVGKQTRIIRAAAQLLQHHKNLAALRVRFDVVAITDIRARIPRIEWIQHAFSG
jgi:putative endonuclease